MILFKFPVHNIERSFYCMYYVLVVVLVERSSNEFSECDRKKIDQIYWLVNYFDVSEMLFQKSFRRVNSR